MPFGMGQRLEDYPPVIKDMESVSFGDISSGAVDITRIINARDRKHIS